MSSITGKTVVITGAARGIGAETARQLAERGANVGLIDLREDELLRVSSRIGDRAVAATADVTDPRSLNRAIESFAVRFGGIDVVVANAGIAHLETLTGGDPANFDQTLAVNLAGPWHTIRAALAHLRSTRGYALVVASIAAAVHPPLHGAYAASKAGVEALSDVLRIELAADGVEVGVAYFPYIDTPMVRDAFSTPVGGDLWERVTFPLSHKVPVERAGQAMVNGIERRARRVYTPAWVRPALIARSLLPRVVEAQMRRAAVHEVVARFDRGAQDDKRVVELFTTTTS
jgi:NAD(P)-dependent dehydrogenase (short-subunit alcohol dehydrogenase family)